MTADSIRLTIGPKPPSWQPMSPSPAIAPVSVRRVYRVAAPPVAASPRPRRVPGRRALEALKEIAFLLGASLLLAILATVIISVLMIGFGNTENAAQPTDAGTQTLSRQTPANDAPTSYRIQAGDTLRSIAQRAYGDQSLWWVIYQANRGSLTAPDDLRIGTEIIIPSR